MFEQVADLRYHILSQPTLVKNRDAHEGKPTGVLVYLIQSARSTVRRAGTCSASLYG